MTWKECLWMAGKEGRPRRENSTLSSRVRSCQPAPVVAVAELPDQGQCPALSAECVDRRQFDPVEGGILDKGVESHVAEHETVTDLQRFREGIFADHVAGQTGDAAEPPGMGQFSGGRRPR